MLDASVLIDDEGVAVDGCGLVGEIIGLYQKPFIIKLPILGSSDADSLYFSGFRVGCRTEIEFVGVAVKLRIGKDDI